MPDRPSRRRRISSIRLPGSAPRVGPSYSPPNLEPRFPIAGGGYVEVLPLGSTVMGVEGDPTLEQIVEVVNNPLSPLRNRERATAERAPITVRPVTNPTELATLNEWRIGRTWDEELSRYRSAYVTSNDLKCDQVGWYVNILIEARQEMIIRSERAYDRLFQTSLPLSSVTQRQSRISMLMNRIENDLTILSRMTDVLTTGSTWDQIGAICPPDCLCGELHSMVCPRCPHADYFPGQIRLGDLAINDWTCPSCGGKFVDPGVLPARAWVPTSVPALGQNPRWEIQPHRNFVRRSR